MKPRNRQGFLLLAEPLKTLGKKGKTLKIARNSLKRKKARKTKKARKRRLGKLSDLKRCVPKTLAFAFGLLLRSKTRCFQTRVLGRRLPNGKLQERLRFRDLRSKTPTFKKRIAIVFLRFWRLTSGPGLAFRSFAFKKTRRFAFAFLSPSS